MPSPGMSTAPGWIDGSASLQSPWFGVKPSPSRSRSPRARPRETTRLTAVPAAAIVPAAGFWLITASRGTVRLFWLVTAPTPNPAARMSAWALLRSCPTTFGTRPGGGGPEATTRLTAEPGGGQPAAGRTLAHDHTSRDGGARLRRDRAHSERGASEGRLGRRLRLTDHVGHCHRVGDLDGVALQREGAPDVVDLHHDGLRTELGRHR